MKLSDMFIRTIYPVKIKPKDKVFKEAHFYIVGVSGDRYSSKHYYVDSLGYVRFRAVWLCLDRFYKKCKPNKEELAREIKKVHRDIDRAERIIR